MAKPVVDGIVQDVGSTAQVMRLNVLDDVGYEIAQRYGVRGLPTFIVFDAQGQPVDILLGIPDRAQVVNQLKQLSVK
jgi:thioredoxin-like negative regulator of GroEL